MRIKIGWSAVIVTLLLCILKVGGLLSIPWIWCFCILWFPIVLGLGLFTIVCVGLMLTALVLLIIDLLENEKRSTNC